MSILGELYKNLFETRVSAFCRKIKTIKKTENFLHQRNEKCHATQGKQTCSCFYNSQRSLHIIDIEGLQNRLLKVCYVPATSAGLASLLFFLGPLTVLMKQTRQPVHAIKLSIYLHVHGSNPQTREY